MTAGEQPKTISDKRKENSLDISVFWKKNTQKTHKGKEKVMLTKHIG